MPSKFKDSHCSKRHKLFSFLGSINLMIFCLSRGENASILLHAAFTQINFQSKTLGLTVDYSYRYHELQVVHRLDNSVGQSSDYDCLFRSVMSLV